MMSMCCDVLCERVHVTVPFAHTCISVFHLKINKQMQLKLKFFNVFVYHFSLWVCVCVWQIDNGNNRDLCVELLSSFVRASIDTNEIQHLRWLQYGIMCLCEHNIFAEYRFNFLSLLLIHSIISKMCAVCFSLLSTCLSSEWMR